MKKKRTERTEESKIITHEIQEEMKNSYIDYAMSVIVGRALPDVRDGLKPVHRRILYGMSGLGMTPDKPHRKSARIVGEVMGKYHPHGDSSIYDAMVKMAQPFATRYPLIDGHGNFGSIDGDGAAAMRYTEARMTPFAMQMIRDIEKDTVDFVPNFDEEEREPVVLPSRIPNLLVNGSSGIAVGMATSIPPHNLKEVIDACVKMIDDAKCTAEDIIKIVKGPDFPTGAVITDAEEIKAAYRTGQGKITVRAVAHIEEGSQGKPRIIITEIPYQVNKARLLERIGDLVREKKIDTITGVSDESSKEGMRIVISVKRGASPEKVLETLYKTTPLQDTYSIIMLAIAGGKPKILTLHEILQEYLKHQKNILTRRTRYELKKAEEREHILKGYKIALANINKIIKIIRESYNDARAKLMKAFGLSQIQAQAILDMKLGRLQGLEKEKIEKEYKETKERIKYLKSLLSSERKLMGVVKDELLDIKKKWGDSRKTEILTKGKASRKSAAKKSSTQKVAVSLSYKGHLKRDVSVEKILSYSDKYPAKQIIETKPNNKVAVFTERGQLHFIEAENIPDTPKGSSCAVLLETGAKEKILSIATGSAGYITAASSNGLVKRINTKDIKKEGTYFTLSGRNKVVNAVKTTGKDRIILITENGKAILFEESDISTTGMSSKGVKGIELEKGDKVVAMSVLKARDSLLIITENEYVKKVPASEYKLQARGGKGILTIDKASKKNEGKITDAAAVEGRSFTYLDTGAVFADVEPEKIKPSKRTERGKPQK